MRVLLLGATGRTGRLVLERLRATDHIVTSVGRSIIHAACAPNIKNYPLDMTLLLQASLHHDVVINCLRASYNPRLYMDIVSALEVSYRRVRYLTVGGLGVQFAGDQLGLVDKMACVAMRVFGDDSLTERQNEADFLQQSALDWTMLRIPRLVDGEATNAWTLKMDMPVSSYVTRSDLADAIVTCVAHATHSRAAPFLTLVEQDGKMFV